MTPVDKPHMPPRVWAQILCQPFSKTPDVIHVRVTTRCKTYAMPGDLEYLSLQEHTALLQEERARGIREAARLLSSYGSGVLACHDMVQNDLEELAARSPGAEEK